MSPPASRLALGTAQFGLSYGVANKIGQVAPREIGRILASAAVAGIDTLDTAVAYGDAESVLGSVGVRGWRVVSKVPAVPAEEVAVGEWVERNVRGSLQRLGIRSLHGLLLHRAWDLLEPGGHDLYDAMVALKEAGLTRALGVSVYSPEELGELMKRFNFDLVQAPFNVVDRRFERSGWLSRLKEAGIEVHTRSVFLQGLLLMSRSARPTYFSRWESVWQRWQDWLDKSRVSPLEACLGFVLARPEIDRVIVGVDSLDQLAEAVDGAGRSPSPPPDDLSSDDVDLVNPSRWPQRA